MLKTFKIYSVLYVVAFYFLCFTSCGKDDLSPQSSPQSEEVTKQDDDQKETPPSKDDKPKDSTQASEDDKDDKPSDPIPPSEDDKDDKPSPPTPPSEGDKDDKPSDPTPPSEGDKDDKPSDPTPPSEGDKDDKPIAPTPPSEGDKDDKPSDPTPPSEGDKDDKPSDPTPPSEGDKDDKPSDPTPPSEGDKDDKPDTALLPWRAEARAGQTWWMQGVNEGVSSPQSWRHAFGEVKALEWEAGMGWYDLNKFDAHRGGTDSDLCWAAVCANIIQWWLDQNHRYILRYGKTVPSGFVKAWKRAGDEGEGFYRSEIFELYRQHFANRGGDLKASIEWFFNGMYAHKPLGGAGFFREVLGEGFRPVTQIGTSARTFSDDIAEALKRGEGLGCSLEYPNGYLHALSIWGADFDATGKLTHIYLTDSNDRTLAVDNRNNARETKAGLLRRAIKLDTITGHVLQEGGYSGIFNYRIIHLYKLPLYQDKWEAYLAK